MIVFAQEDVSQLDSVPLNQAEKVGDLDFDLNQILQKDEKSVTSDQDQNRIEITQDVKVEQIVEPVNDYQYSSFGAPSPFEEPISLQSDEQNTVENASNIPGMPEIPIVSPLQKFDLGQLHVKGIWRLANRQWRAILLTPEQEGVIVQKGDPVSAGKVISITSKSVTIRQYKVRPDGTRFFSDKDIHLHKKTMKNTSNKNSAGPGEIGVDAAAGQLGGGPHQPASSIEKKAIGKDGQLKAGGVNARNP